MTLSHPSIHLKIISQIVITIIIIIAHIINYKRENFALCGTSSFVVQKYVYTTCFSLFFVACTRVTEYF